MQIGVYMETRKSQELLSIYLCCGVFFAVANVMFISGVSLKKSVLCARPHIVWNSRGKYAEFVE